MIALETHGVRACSAKDGDQDRCQCHQVLDAMLDAVTDGRWVRMGLRLGNAEVPRANIQYELRDRSEIYGSFASHWVAYTTDPEMERFCPRLRKLLLPLVIESKKTHFSEGEMEASFQKSLFMTKSGAMGLCHPHAREGDPVVVLFGCRVPVILTQREVDNSDRGEWRFIGGCYLNGLMYGEAVKAKINLNVPVQTFKLS